MEKISTLSSFKSTKKKKTDFGKKIGKMQTLEDFELDLDNRSPEEEGVGVVGRHSLPEGETGDRGTASEENLEGTLAES